MSTTAEPSSPASGEVSEQYARTHIRWGEGDAMNPLETMMWRAEADPRLRSHGVVVELLGSTPDWERMKQGCQWAVARINRLRERVQEDPTNLGPPAFVPAEVDLTYHVRRTVLPPGGTVDDVLEIAAAMAMEGFDTARPLWRLEMVEGLPDGQCAVLTKVHHSLADGTAGMQLFDLLHSDRAEPSVKPLPPREVSTAVASGPALAVRNALRIADATAGSAARTVAKAPLSALGALKDPLGTVGGWSRYMASLARVTASAPGTPSPLLQARGLSRRVAILDYSYKELRAGAKAAGGTLNDGFITGLTGGLARYHAAYEEPVGDLPMALPVSLRKADDQAGGNRFAGARIGAPCGETDPVKRLQLIRSRVLAARNEPALDFLGSMAPVVSRAPTSVVTSLTASFTTSLDLQASNFPGLRRDSYIAGCHVDRMYCVGPAPGSAMMAVLVTHQDRCCICLNIDAAAVPDVDLLKLCMTEGFDEVVALGTQE